MGEFVPPAALSVTAAGLGSLNPYEHAERLLPEAQHQEQSGGIHLSVSGGQIEETCADLLATSSQTDQGENAARLLRRVVVSHVDEKHAHMDPTRLLRQACLPQVPGHWHYCVWSNKYKL